MVTSEFGTWRIWYQKCNTQTIIILKTIHQYCVFLNRLENECFTEYYGKLWCTVVGEFVMWNSALGTWYLCIRATVRLGLRVNLSGQDYD